LQPDPDAELTEAYVIRPTSETIIGEAMSRWVQSWRDLPLKLNQWVNVMRWEMRPRMFLRTSEFNWQEGHNVFATHEEANADARKMHAMYAEYMKNVLAAPVIAGEKTPEERFAGADHTYTVEQIMQDGKALQAGTSHDLGQHFAKSFNIQYLGTDGKLQYAWTTSWGTSTRMMGGLFMIHSDDDGLVLPPMIAPYQIVIIPIVREESADSLNEYAEKLGEKLRESNLRVLVDTTDMRAPDKMWKWIKRGVPLRVEIGAREMENNTVTITRRDLGKESKRTITTDELIATANDIMKTMQVEMYERALKRQNEKIHDVKTLAELEKELENGTIGFFRIKYDLTTNDEFEGLIEKYKISRRCLDNDDPTFVYVAKSY